MQFRQTRDRFGFCLRRMPWQACLGVLMSVPSLGEAFDDMDEAHPEEGAGQVTPSRIESKEQGAEAESLAAMRGQRIGDGTRACTSLVDGM